MKKSISILIFHLFSCCFVSAQSGTWTWMKGDSIGNQSAIWGTKGVASPSNKPKGRYEAGEWVDNQGNFWFFGGSNPFNFDVYNDLWKYSPSLNEWTWVWGDSIPNQIGNYGIQGVPSPSNKPGSRGLGFVTWTDSNGNLWMFGGEGYDATGFDSNLNDLWKYDPLTNEWTWMTGSTNGLDAGHFGTKGVSSPLNSPPNRCETACGWTDSNGNLWMFGGNSFEVQSNQNVLLNDLWKYNIATNEWIWMSGDNSGSNASVYGTIGISSPNNKPSGRWCYDSWKDNSGNLWLWGGEAFDGTGGNIYNDLWRYNISSNEWTWMSGSNTSQPPPIYGTSCSDTSFSMPTGAVETRARWTDACGNFWLYGTGSSNSLFYYSASDNKWTWVRGSTPYPSYGTIGVPSPVNTPGERTGVIAWYNKDGLWLFGGAGSDNTHLQVNLNDLWKFVPDTGCGACLDVGINGFLVSENISVYPNPFSNSTTIKIPEKISIENAEIKIYDVYGKVVRDISGITSHEIIIDREGLNAGLYFVTLKSSGDKINFDTKLIVE